MKTVFVLFCVLATILADLPNLPEDERIKLSEVHNDCQSDPATFCDEDKLRNLFNNVDDYQVGVHMFCMAVKADLMTEDGDFDFDIITEKVSLVTADQTKVSGLVSKCTQNAESIEKTANLMWICFVENDIQYYYEL